MPPLRQPINLYSFIGPVGRYRMINQTNLPLFGMLNSKTSTPTLLLSTLLLDYAHID